LAGSISNAAPPQTPDEAPFPAEDTTDPWPGDAVTSALAPVFVGFEEVQPAVSIRAIMTAHRATEKGRFIGYSSHMILEIIMISMYFSGPIEPELPHQRFAIRTRYPAVSYAIIPVGMQTGRKKIRVMGSSSRARCRFSFS
jgi:hypothetical protein